MQEEEEACGIAVLSGGYHEVDVAMLNEHVGDAVVEHDRILRLRIGLRWKGEELESEDSRCESEWKREERWSGRNLFLDELGEEAFSVDGGDVASVVAPDEDAAFDVEEEQSRGCPCHCLLLQWSDPGFQSDQRHRQQKKGEEQHEKQGLLYDAVTTKWLFVFILIRGFNYFSYFLWCVSSYL